jgi:hypothetical protein
MRRVRVQIGSLVLRHPSLQAADGPAVARMIEEHVQRLLQSGAPQNISSAGLVRLNYPAPANAHTREGVARSIAQALHRGLSVGSRG